MKKTIKLDEENVKVKSKYPKRKITKKISNIKIKIPRSRDKLLCKFFSRLLSVYTFLREFWFFITNYFFDLSRSRNNGHSLFMV